MTRWGICGFLELLLLYKAAERACNVSVVETPPTTGHASLQHTLHWRYAVESRLFLYLSFPMHYEDKIKLSTSSAVGMEGAAPILDTVIAEALVALSNACLTDNP